MVAITVEGSLARHFNSGMAEVVEHRITFVTKTNYATDLITSAEVHHVVVMVMELVLLLPLHCVY